MTAPSDKHTYLIPKPSSYQSQHGEDKWLDEHFLQKKHGFFVEVGAYDGIVLSNTYHFEKERAWTGILVEPDANKAELCRRNRPNSRTYECASVGSEDIQSISFYKVDGGEVYSTTNLINSHLQRLNEYGLAYREVRVQAMTLDRMLTEVNPTQIDFVSIDVEEGELEVLKGFNIRRWKPKFIIVETNSGERKAEIRDYFVGNGYAYLKSIAINDFYSPAAGGPLFAAIIDFTRYNLMRRRPQRLSLRRRIRAFFNRNVLWRFKNR